MSVSQKLPLWVGIALIGGHIGFGVARLPGKVMGRRIEDIRAYEEQGAATFLIERAHLTGSDAVRWVLDHTSEDCVVLWKWPADGALEFCGALLAPRLLVDQRVVPVGETSFAGRTIARITLPTGEQGLAMLQGTDDAGVRLVVRD